MPEVGQSFNSLIKSLSGFGSLSSNLAELSVTGERQRIRPSIDYNLFSNHVFFGDGLRKYRNTLKKIENTYPIGLSAGDTASLSSANIFAVDKWKKEASGFDLFVLDELSLTNTLTAAATNNDGDTIFLTFVNRTHSNTITGSQAAVVDSISGKAVDFEEQNIDIVTKTSGSSNDHIDYPLTAETTISRSPKLKNMLPEVLFFGDDNEVLEKLLQSFGDLLDELKGFADQLSHIKHTSYEDVNRVPNKFLPVLAAHFGITLYQSAVNSAIESFFTKSTTGAPKQEIAFDLWNRILNNLIYLLKRKGTKEVIDAIGRIYGIDHNFLKVDEYSFLNRDRLVKVREEVDTPTLFSTGDVYVQAPTGTLSAFDFAPSANFTIQMRVSATSATEHMLFVHPLYKIKLDASGNVHFITTGTTTASTTQSSISSFIQTKDKFLNVAVTRDDATVKVYAMVVSGSGSGGDDVVIMNSGSTGSMRDESFYSSAGASAFGGYFPGSGSFSGYMHEVRIWSVALDPEDLREQTRNFESASFCNSTASLSATYGSLSAHYKLKENRVIPASHNFIVDSTTAANTATPINFANQTDKRYRVFSNMPKISSWYPTGLTVDNDKVRQTDTENDIADSGNISMHMTPVNAINRDIRNTIQELNIKELMGDPADLYKPGYNGPITATLNDVMTRYGTVMSEGLESGSGLSAAAQHIGDFNTFIDVMDNFNDVMCSIFPFMRQFLPAKSVILSEGILIEPHILHRPKEERQEYGINTISPTSVKINTHFLELDTTAASASTTANFQGFQKKDRIQKFINRSLTGSQAIKTLSNRNGDSFSIPRFSQTRIGRFLPAKVTPSNTAETDVQITLSRLLISPTAGASAINANINGEITLLKSGKPFLTQVPALKFEFPSSADGTNYFKAVIGDIDNGKGRVIEGKDTEFTTKIDTKKIQMKLQLADVVKSFTADANSLSGEIGIVNINVTNLFNNSIRILRVAIGNRQELFDELAGGQGGEKINT